jgi:hypothetical protein
MDLIDFMVKMGDRCLPSRMLDNFIEKEEK